MGEDFVQDTQADITLALVEVVSIGFEAGGDDQGPAFGEEVVEPCPALNG